MVIAFYDNGILVVGPLSYEDTIWAEGQLTEAEEDVIEHLGIGESAELSGGWIVKRLS